MFYISRLQIGRKTVERINTGDDIESVKTTVERINTGDDIESVKTTVERINDGVVLAIRAATDSEVRLIEDGHVVTFIRQVGINP